MVSIFFSSDRSARLLCPDLFRRSRLREQTSVYDQVRRIHSARHGTADGFKPA